MKLRSYILLVTVGLLIPTLAFLILEIRSTLSEAANELHAEFQQDLAKVLRTAVHAERDELQNYGRLLSENNDLAGSFILARETKDQDLLVGKLQHIREQTGFDVVEVVALDDIARTAATYGMSEDDVRETLGTPRTRDLVRTLGDHPTLLHLTSLRLYGDRVAVLILGRRLDGGLRDEFKGMSDAEISFDVAPGADLVPILTDEGSSLYARINTDSRIEHRLSNELKRRLVVSGLVALLIFLVATQIALEPAVTQPLGRIARTVRYSTESVRRGELSSFPPQTFRITEINEISSAFGVMTSSLSDFQSRLLRESQVQADLERRTALGDMASQVAHDIRSPLTALDLAVQTLKSIPESHRILIRESVTRIKDIANLLLERKRTSSERTEQGADAVLLSTLVESIAAEKRTHFRARSSVDIGVEIAPDAHDLFVRAASSELKRVLSNLCDNAVEALIDSGKVTIALRRDGTRAELVIEDTGRGIPEDVIGRLGQRGFSYGKPGGAGLGLHHAFEVAERWGGTCRIQSRLDQGTSVHVLLPLTLPPYWYCTHLDLRNRRNVCVIDDDQSIHEVWARRLEPIAARAGVRHFRSGDELARWLGEAPERRENLVLLMDFEFLNSTRDGLTVAQELRLESDTILVTSRYEAADVQARASTMGISILPKHMAPHVAILAEEWREDSDAHGLGFL